MEFEAASYAASARDCLLSDFLSLPTSARDCLLSDFLSQPTSARPRSTGEPLHLRGHSTPMSGHKRVHTPQIQPEESNQAWSSEGGNQEETRTQGQPQSLADQYASLTSISSDKSEGIEHDPFYLPPCETLPERFTKLQRRMISPGSSFARSESESRVPSEELSRSPSSVESIDDDDSPSTSKRRSSHRDARDALHRLSRKLGIENDDDACEQSVGSDFFASDDYVGFTSNRGSQSRRHSFFSRLSRQG